MPERSIASSAPSTPPRPVPPAGAPTDIRERDGRLWLECSTTPVGPPNGLRARLEAALAPHPRAIVLDLTDRAAA